MKIYGVQLDIQWENKAANYARVHDLIEKSAPEAGSLVVLPEMFATGFSMNVEAVTENSSETERFLQNLAREFSINIVAGVAVSNGDEMGRNEALFVAPDEEKSIEQSTRRYCKMHPFTFGGESAHYVRGEKLCGFAWQNFQVAPFICYDLRFPEIFRAATKNGANLFCVIANWPAPREAHWRALLMARAIENQAYVIGVNRCGTDPKLHYAGRSQIIDPHGQILADGGGKEGIISAELNLASLEKYRRDFPVLADMKF